MKAPPKLTPSVPRKRQRHGINTYRWQRLRKSMLVGQCHMCVRCKERGMIEPATEVHHVVPRHVRPDLAFEPDNLMPLCKACHEAEHK